MRLSHAIAAIALMAGFALSGTGCSREVLEETPAEIVGVWVTSSPRYKDRHFEIRNNTFVIGAGAAETQQYPLRGVRVIGLDDGRLRYTLYYTEPDGAKSTFSFYFDGTIRLVNRPDVPWVKKEPRDAHAT